MPTRRHYLVTYDIADDKRRNTVFRTLHGFGDHAQYSVFFCELNARELVQLRSRLREAVHQREDQVLILDLGQASRPLDATLEVLGKGYQPPVRTIVI
jgi:CRISPR-associated protein Cas2